MALSRASAFLLTFPRCFFFSAFAFIFLAHVIPFPLSSPSFHLLFPKLAPMLLQMHFNSPVDFFFPCLLRLLVFFFHTLTSQTRCSPFLCFLSFMSPFAWSVTEASLRAQPLILQCFSKSLAVLNVNQFWAALFKYSVSVWLAGSSPFSSFATLQTLYLQAISFSGCHLQVVPLLLFLLMLCITSICSTPHPDAFSFNPFSNTHAL